MSQSVHAEKAIPISPSLSEIRKEQQDLVPASYQKKRLLYISVVCVALGVIVSLVAKTLIYLIDVVTNLSFFGKLSLEFNSPADNQLGVWVIAVPALGGIIVGLMALYGSKAIRGHGIPEAMEQILTNQSKIRPSMAFLKPVSSAIAIGSGGPFGAEGPIIATGGALGSTLGQLIKITSQERKIILAAGATAGMSAIFGTPIAAVFLAIELLLFEFSPRAILPVALACITGAAGHHLLFETGPVFPMPNLEPPTNLALAVYSLIGILIGFTSMGLTKLVYFIEDAFEKLPIHWMWWPALGGLVVGAVGYFHPYTLGVGYDNILGVLSGKLPLAFMLSLLFFKLLSWSVALGSGTSGGTLAPLLTIGGAAGAVLGSLILQIFPDAGINVPTAALIGMASMFAGASRAFLTSITFALEATMQSHALLPLLAACTGSYLVSFFFMENTIMTEKIARRGVFTPNSYEPDVLEKLTVADVRHNNHTILNADSEVQQVKQFFKDHPVGESRFLVVNNENRAIGVLELAALHHAEVQPDEAIRGLAKRNVAHVTSHDRLTLAIQRITQSEMELLAILNEDDVVTGVLSQSDIIRAYGQAIQESRESRVHLSIRRERKKMLMRGKKIFKAKG
ncbi:MAG TPA: chloride channel protein [Sphingobacteriaceae bacterium]